MRIPIFLSSPTQLSPRQDRSRKVVLGILNDLRVEPRALGRSDYPKDVPLKEVLAIARHCHGGVILGFEQYRATTGLWRPGTKEQRRTRPPEVVRFPTPWNQLEAGILFGLKLPLLIFREPGVVGGVLDVGTTEVFVHDMPPARPDKAKLEELMEVFLKWHAEVSRNYYSG
jgi:hypothetical protein